MISRDLAATVNALCAGINLSILTVFVNDTEDVHEAVEVNLFLLLTFTQLHIERVPADRAQRTSLSDPIKQRTKKREWIPDAVIECVVGVRLLTNQQVHSVVANPSTHFVSIYTVSSYTNMQWND